MSSGFRIDPSSSSNLDYGRGNDDGLHEDDGRTNPQTPDQKSYIDRSKGGQDKPLDKRKARKKDQKKKKKISERNTREFNEDQKDE